MAACRLCAAGPGRHTAPLESCKVHSGQSPRRESRRSRITSMKTEGTFTPHVLPSGSSVSPAGTATTLFTDDKYQTTPTTAAEGTCPEEIGLLQTSSLEARTVLGRGKDSESRSAAGPGAAGAPGATPGCRCTKESQLSVTGLGNWPPRVTSVERLQVKSLPKKLRKH